MAKVLTEDEARRIASNIAKLPTYSAKVAERRLRAARAWQQCHNEQEFVETLAAVRALNAVERVVRLGNPPR